MANKAQLIETVAEKTGLTKRMLLLQLTPFLVQFKIFLKRAIRFN